MSTQEIHQQVLDIYLEHKKQNPEFTFSPRVHQGPRLFAGYWFQGTENYLFSAPFNRGDSNNKTKTIGYVLSLDNGQVVGSYIEVVFGHPLNLEFIDFYKKVLEVLGLSYEEGRYKYQKKIEGDWKQGLRDFLKHDVARISDIISEFDLEEDFIVPEATLTKRLNRVEAIRKQGLRELGADKSEETETQDTESSRNSSVLSSKQQARNIIMYGPPGTGKTYNTKHLALELIEGQSESDLTREEVNDTFNEYVDSGQVVFTTFHQSMGYEDFVEGIKPDLKSDDITYIRSDGIFKKIADEARNNFIGSNAEGTQKQDAHIKSLFQAFTNHVEQKLEDGFIPLTDKVSITDIDDESLRYKGESWGGAKGNKIKFSELEHLYRNNVESRQDVKRLKGISGLGFQHATYFFNALELLRDFERSEYKASTTETSKDELKQYVIIIDEINRGNVASIFGELITLIETDKRYGSKEALSLMLPYSKKSFSVPPNLHIVATMNTADRSVEALDTALRRRFTFKELMPDPSLLSHDPYKEFARFIIANRSNDLAAKSFKESAEDLLSWLNLVNRTSKDFRFEQLIEEFTNNQELLDFRDDPDYGESVAEFFKGKGIKFNPIRLDSLLSTINKRLTYLLDRDHTIGHSYFMGVNSLSSLRKVFQDQIIPQLKEYFYGDWTKIGMVLGDRFVKVDKEEVMWPARFNGTSAFDDNNSLIITSNWSISDFQSIYQAQESD